MKTSEELKAIVRDKYGKIVKNEIKPESSCCGPVDHSCCGNNTYSVFNDSYKSIEGHLAEADLGLGCGIPTEHAKIKEGNCVLDLGSGAGNDVFVARRIVGSEGRVIGLDMTREMYEKAIENNKKLGYENVEFILGEIEDIPLPEKEVDVVISNCVLNLVPDKDRAYEEVFRVLKPGGHFSISDIVIEGEMSEAVRSAAELYAGCVGGALQQKDYLSSIYKAGFIRISVPKKKEIILPDTLLQKYLSADEVHRFKKDKIGIYSITVVGYKS